MSTADSRPDHVAARERKRTKRPKREPRMHRPACALKPNHKGECRDNDGWPARWSDPTYLGDGPWGA